MPKPNASETERVQVNVRLDQEFVQLLDGKRIALQKELGVIPTRSDVVRLALEKYLKVVAPKK